MNFKDQVVFITGGSSGIGMALARLLAEQGARVWLLARSPDRLEAALAELRSLFPGDPDRFGTVSADVADPDAVRESVDYVTARAGLPDLVINSAGIVESDYVQNLSLEVFHRLMDVNYFGTVYVSKAVLPGMIQRRSGHIVNVASSAAYLGVHGYAAYAASKWAVRGFSEVLRAEMKPYNVNVSVVFPPDTDTPQLAYDKQHRPPEVDLLGSMAGAMSAGTCAWSIMDGVARRRFVIVPGRENRFWYRVIGLIGDWTYPVMDWIVARSGINHQKD